MIMCTWFFKFVWHTITDRWLVSLVAKVNKWQESDCWLAAHVGAEQSRGNESQICHDSWRRCHSWCVTDMEQIAFHCTWPISDGSFMLTGIFVQLHPLLHFSLFFRSFTIICNENRFFLVKFQTRLSKLYSRVLADTNTLKQLVPGK